MLMASSFYLPDLSNLKQEKVIRTEEIKVDVLNIDTGYYLYKPNNCLSHFIIIKRHKYSFTCKNVLHITGNNRYKLNMI